MIQNFLALIIVFAAAGYTVFSIYKNITARKASECGGGCAGCSFKELPLNTDAKARNTEHKIQSLKHVSTPQPTNFRNQNFQLPT